MLLATAVKGMLHTRHILESKEAVSLPVFISENIQRLAQYTASIEEHLAQLESDLAIKEASAFKTYLAAGKSANMSGELLKHEFSEDRAEIIKLTRYVNSSWKLISVGQSRIKHLIAEANNQI
jgi:hypothetical protein